MTVRDLTPEQRIDLLQRWDAAVRCWWSDRDINPAHCDYMAWRARYVSYELERPFATPEAVAFGA